MCQVGELAAMNGFGCNESSNLNLSVQFILFNLVVSDDHKFRWVFFYVLYTFRKKLGYDISVTVVIGIL